MTMDANRLADEVGRLQALELLDAEAHSSEASFDHITKLLQLILGMETVTINLITKDEQKSKSRQGPVIPVYQRETAFCNITIQGYEPLIIEDARQEPLVRDNPFVTGPPFLRSYIGAPLTTSEGYNLGAICALDSQPRRFTPTEIEILFRCAELVMNQLELRSQADRDFLTKVYNRRSFMSSLDQELARLARSGGTAGLALLDIDHFKRVNDTFGHPAGDRVLREFARLLESECRQSDLIARIGGEEFAVLLPQTNRSAAWDWANRLRAKVATTYFDEDNALRLTVSVGLIEIDGAITTSDSLMAIVDDALYKAKKSGRDRIVVR